MAYCVEADLLLGDMQLGGVDPDKYINLAANEMDSKLGFVYDLPLAPCDDSDVDAMPDNEVGLLKDINLKLASGRLILSQYVGGEDTGQHAYGMALVREALEGLMLIANGSIDLSACRRAEPDLVANSRVPSAVVYDEESMSDAFEKTVFKEDFTYAQPGAAP